MSDEQASAAASPQGDGASAAAGPTAAHPGRRRKRRLFLRLLALVVLLAALAWGAWYLLDGRWYEHTDDAYVQGDIVQVMARVPGTVTEVAADDNDFVQQGQPLVTLDASDADVALAQAKAALGQAVRQVSGLYSSVKTSEAEVRVNQTAVRQAQADLQRRRQLAQSGAISSEELTHAQAALSSAQAALAGAQSRQATAQAQTEGTAVATHPDVQAAVAQLRQAWLADARTVVPAPVSGYVAKRSVQLGQHAQPGTALMAVVPLSSVWVDANFKETQLRHMRIGQPVTLTADLYGSDVTYHGHVAGLGVGTGSAFSLLPAQNATGNWIKIVQRLPVRIVLAPDALQAHPLRIGLSMQVKVDLHDDSGAMLSDTPRVAGALHTDVYEEDDAELEALIDRIVAENSGAKASVAARQAKTAVAAGS